MALSDLAVNGDLLAGTHQHHVARHDLFDRQVDLDPVAQDSRGACLHAEQPSDRFAGAGLSSDLDQPTEEDQREDEPDVLEVHTAHVDRGEGGCDRDHQAVGERRAGPQRDERIHVCVAMDQGEPAGAVNRPAGVEEHRSDHREREPRVSECGRKPRGVKEVLRHHAKEHRRREYGPQENSSREVGDFGAAFNGLLVITVGLSRAGVAVSNDGWHDDRRPGAIASCGTGRRRDTLVIHSEDAVVHVHATGEGVYARRVGNNLNHRLGECR